MTWKQEAKAEKQKYYSGYKSMCKQLGFVPVPYHAFTIKLHNQTKDTLRKSKKMTQKELNEYTADKARAKIEEDKTELYGILRRIDANVNARKLHIFHKPLMDHTKVELISRGFKIYDQPATMVQRDNIYHTIKW
jgi:hypothetical protein